MSTTDIFAETDIIPFVGEGGARIYYDLGDPAAAEIRWLREARERQLRPEAPPLERELTAIVAEFRKDLKTKAAIDDASTHFELGLAYMGQGLMAEAVDELTEAAKDPKLAFESYTAIAEAYKQRGELDEAQKWTDKAGRVGPQK